MVQPPEATVLDKAKLVPQVAFAVGSGLAHALATLISGGSQASTKLKDVVYAILRSHLTSLNIAQEQWLNTTTGEVYRGIAKSQGFQPETDTLGSGLQVHWIGGKTAQKTIVYLHGGGYVMGAAQWLLQWVVDFQKVLGEKRSVNIMLVEYTLAPRAQYPTQLKQAVEAFQWLLQSQQKKPSDIILAGDSAGGNLSLGLLSHILHPHPQIPTKIELSEPLAGLVLISPWISFSLDHDSISRNAGSDFLPPNAAVRWSSLFMGSAPRDNYNQPFFADSEWFKGLDRLAKDVLIWGGGGEVLIDSIKGVAEKIQKAHPRVEFVVQPAVAHEDFMVEVSLGGKDAEGTKLITQWVLERL